VAGLKPVLLPWQVGGSEHGQVATSPSFEVCGDAQQCLEKLWHQCMTLEALPVVHADDTWVGMCKHA